MKIITACLFSILLTCASITCGQELNDFNKPNKVDQLSSGIPAPSAKRQVSKNEGTLSRLNKESTNKPQATIANDTGKNLPLATSNFSLHYAPNGDRAALEYRMSENGTLRLRGGHRGVKLVAAWKY
ncbi:MAG: hypothetical protein H7252_05725 [Cytophaga sp.]|nr:hypothetical protein [Undibacterium sp.]